MKQLNQIKLTNYTTNMFYVQNVDLDLRLHVVLLKFGIKNYIHGVGIKSVH